MIILSQDKNGNTIITQNPEPETYEHLAIDKTFIRPNRLKKSRLLQVIRGKDIILIEKDDILNDVLIYLAMDGDIITSDHHSILRVVHNNGKWSIEPIKRPDAPHLITDIMNIRKILLKVGIRMRNRSSVSLDLVRDDTDWEPIPPEDLDELAEFIRTTYIWTKDSILDNVCTVPHMNYQLLTTGKIRGDCDDLATYSGYLLHRMGYEEVYRVNIWEGHHVVCAFHDVNGWKVIDNLALFNIPHSTLYNAVYEANIDRGEWLRITIVEEKI